MMTRLLPLLLLTLAASGKSVPQEQDLGDGPVLKGLKIHEWGVFLVGKKDTRASAGGEPPTFIQRVKMGEKPAEDLPTADKPVLHIYHPGNCGPVDLKIRVAFPGGRPLLAWPRGTPEWRGCINPVPGLAWELKVIDEIERKLADPLEVPKGHWIAACRNVGASRLFSGNDHDRFLFYEGEVAPIGETVAVGRNEEGYSLTSATMDQAWIVEGGTEGLAVLHETGMVWKPGDEERLRRARPARPCAPEALRKDLAKALASAGLSDAEAACVLDIWMPELLKPGKRLVYLLPRSEYDRLLPITFDPAPEELARVGLVVQEITP